MADSTPQRPPSLRSRWRTILDVLTTFVVLAAAIVVLRHYWSSPTQTPRSVPVPSGPVFLGGAAVLGSATAPAAILEFSEFQCPFCGKFARETLPEFHETYVKSGQVALMFRHMPLGSHQFAAGAAEAAECAGRAGKFWELHDVMFRD